MFVAVVVAAREINVIDHSCIIKLQTLFHYAASCRKSSTACATTTSSRGRGNGRGGINSNTRAVTLTITTTTTANIHHTQPQQRHYHHHHHQLYSSPPYADQQVARNSPRAQRDGTLTQHTHGHRQCLRWWCGQLQLLSLSLPLSPSLLWWCSSLAAAGEFSSSTCSSFARNSHLWTVVSSRRIKTDWDWEIGW